MTLQSGGDSMASKDQAIGAIIFLICFIIAILYIIGLFYFGGVATAGEAWNAALGKEGMIVKAYPFSLNDF